jgi:signal transduction histidine kinase
MSYQLQNVSPTPVSSITELEKVNVLLVDDRPENLMALEVVLQGLGQNLVKVQSGAAALKYLLHQDVAVILLDVQMPGMDGFETARLIRQRDRSRHTPIIFLTALTESEELRSQGYTLGAVDYLYKPIEPVILTSKVSVFIELFKKNLEIQQQAAQLIAQNIEIVRAQTARQQAEESNRLKDEFLAIVSHELRTPLNSMLGWSQLLLKREFGPDKMQQALETIHRNAQTQAQLIEDILDISRLMRGKVELSIQPINLDSFIHTTVESVRPQAAAKSINLMVQIDPAVSEIQADLVRACQILSNLLTNAIKFTPQGGQVSVQASFAANGYIELKVSDTGIGIHPEFLPHIFDHFRQADSSVTRAYGGLGLGLSIVRQLVELHGGQIQAHSDGCDRGTTFTVHLPIINQHSQGIVNASGISAAILGEECSSLNNLQVLVVEDHTDNREFIQQILQEAGATVLAACCSQEAIAILEQAQPDVILSDIAMPEEDGYQFIQRVRSSKHKDIPAIALTAYARPEDHRAALSAGFQMHLSKPINAQKLVSAIVQVVERSRSSTKTSIAILNNL